jgi:glycosyltransferase involved in cell wall biosynthesis
VSRVVLVGKGPPDRGGIAAFLQALQASDLAAWHDLRLLNLTRDEVPRSGRLTAANVRRTLKDTLTVWRASGDADIVHVHTALVPHVTLARAGMLALAARSRGARPVLHAHSGKVQRWLVSRPRRLAARAALLPAKRVVAVSEGGRRALRPAAGGRLRLIENGVDVGAFSDGPTGNGIPRVLFAGVLTPRKGVVDLLRASALLDRRGASHELVLAGGVPDEGPEAEAVVREAAAGSPARFLGPLAHEEMPALYASVDVFCLPSWWEAMPLSVLEAMAAGLPVVASNVGDVPRVVQDGASGLLVPPRVPEAVADALEALLRDAGMRRAMGEAARARVAEAFDLAETVRSVDALYLELVG